MRRTYRAVDHEQIGTSSYWAEELLARSIGDLRMDWHVLSACRTSSWVLLLAFRVWQFCILLSFVVCSWGPPWLHVCLEVAGGRGGSTVCLRGVGMSRLKYSLL
jgi:hypothetical protein